MHNGKNMGRIFNIDKMELGMLQNTEQLLLLFAQSLLDQFNQFMLVSNAIAMTILKSQWLP